MKKRILITFTLLAALTPLLEARGKKQVTRVRSDLTRPAGAVDDNARGRIEVQSKRGRERLVIQAKRLTRGLVVNFLIADANGDLQIVASGRANSRGQANARWETKDGPLFLDAANVAALAGLAVEVQTAGGAPLLAGVIPGIPVSGGDDDGDGDGDDDHGGGQGGDNRPRQRADSPLENVDRAFAPAGKGKVQVDYRPLEGRSKLEVEVEKVPPGTVLDLFLENPVGGQLEKAGELIANRIGKAQVEFETEHGALLPFGVAAVNAFFGRPLEVRLPGGDAKFRGAVPTP